MVKVEIVIEISARQSLKLFGLWDQPRSIAEWGDFTKKELSWYTLRNNYGFSAQQLKRIQPKKKEWIMRGQLKLFDLLDMRVFPINPFTDLGADLGEVWSMGWTSKELQDMNVTIDQLLRAGMTPQIMTCFRYPLSTWLDFGLEEKHIESEEHAKVFGLGHEECCTIVRDYNNKKCK